MLALPRPKAFVNSGVGVVGCFGGGKLRLHAAHSRTEALPSPGVFFRFWFRGGGL